MSISQHQLRLVGEVEPLHRPEGVSPARQHAAAVRAVAEENQAARLNLALNPSDPRWVVAVRAYSQLQGSTLTPERRRHVQQLASLLGVRPFETNVIMAIVQDHARHGRTLHDAAATIALLEKPVTEPSPTARWFWALVLAAVMCAMLASWLLGR
jgi:hypothetical protein